MKRFIKMPFTSQSYMPESLRPPEIFLWQCKKMSPLDAHGYYYSIFKTNSLYMPKKNGTFRNANGSSITGQFFIYFNISDKKQRHDALSASIKEKKACKLLSIWDSLFDKH
jgi:hypothetical protein